MIATRASPFGGRMSMLIPFSLLTHTGKTGHKLGFDIVTFQTHAPPSGGPFKCADESVWKSAVLKDWMVETEGTALPTPHPVIEPVSDIRVRNGNFRCRDGSVKTTVPPLRDRYRDAQRLERPPFWRD